MRRILFSSTIILVCCFFVMPVWAETFYVRSGCEYNGDGTAFDCAGADGESGAWNTLFNVSWGLDENVRAVGPGDTLYVCGEYNETLYVGASGDSDNVITIRGDHPDSPGTLGKVIGAHSMLISGKSYITVRNLTIRDPYGVEALGYRHDRAGIYIYRPSTHITIDNVTFESTPDVNVYGYGILSVSGAGSDNHHITIQNCSFSNFMEDSIRFSVWRGAAGGQPGTVHHITIADNTFDYVFRAIRFWGTKPDSSLPLDDVVSPYGIDITGNSISNTFYSAIAVQTGFSPSETNYIRNNRLTNISDPDAANVNAMQLNWIRGTIIEDNYINGVYTSACDGSGIILDWAWRRDDAMSDGNFVRRNEISN
ncbi:MAG: right-handed parallel beta-helix repeat-containing protein, partial [Planctomycetota bacterium]